MMSEYFSHPSSVIDPGVEIGTGTKVWHFSHIMGDSVIGENCNLGQNVFVASGVEIGNNVKIQNNVSVYNVINPRSHVNRRDEYQETLVKRGATIGANATIVCGITLGEYSFVGAGAVVTRDIPAYGLVYGNPGKIQGWVCSCGQRLDFGESAEAVCGNCAAAYIQINDTEIKPVEVNE